MRRVATEIGTGTTSLYRYVRSKDELVDLMVDAIMGMSSPPTPSGRWRADLGATAYHYRSMLLEHPWLAGLPADRPSLGPNSLYWMEGAFRTVADMGLSADEMLVNVTTLLTFVRGHVMSELAELDAVRRSGRDIHRWMAAQSELGDMIIRSGHYPTLARIMVEADSPHSDDRLERGFAVGVEHILNGLAATLGSSKSSRPHRQNQSQAGPELVPEAAERTTT
jgi:AcrR family transcriptional regulator